MNVDVIPSHLEKMSQKPKSNLRWRWRSFSLRAMLVLTAVFSVYIASVVRSDLKRRSAADAIAVYGGRVSWEQRGPTWLASLIGRDLYARPKEIGFLNESLPDKALALLDGLQDAEQLLIAQNDTFTGVGFEHLDGFHKLRFLHVYNTPLTDEGVSKLPKLASLERLHLLATTLSDDSLASLESRSELTELFMGSQSLGENVTETLQQMMPKTTIRISRQGYSKR